MHRIARRRGQQRALLWPSYTADHPRVVQRRVVKRRVVKRRRVPGLPAERLPALSRAIEGAGSRDRAAFAPLGPWAPPVTSHESLRRWAPRPPGTGPQKLVRQAPRAHVSASACAPKQETPERDHRSPTPPSVPKRLVKHPQRDRTPGSIWPACPTPRPTVLPAARVRTHESTQPNSPRSARISQSRGRLPAPPNRILRWARGPRQCLATTNRHPPIPNRAAPEAPTADTSPRTARLAGSASPYAVRPMQRSTAAMPITRADRSALPRRVQRRVQRPPSSWRDPHSVTSTPGLVIPVLPSHRVSAMETDRHSTSAFIIEQAYH